MALQILEDDCTNCGVCEPECHVDAITEGEDAYEIDAAKFDECGEEDSAGVDVCPLDCIEPL